MNDATLDLTIETAKARFPAFNRTAFECDSPLSADEIAKIEASRKIQIHPQYRRFLEIHGAGPFYFSTIYSIDVASPWSLWQQSKYLPGVGVSVLPFADNGCGDYYVFKLIDGTCKDVIFWADHEMNYALSPECEDFNTFVAKHALTH